MRNKKFYLMLTILLIVAFSSMAVSCTGLEVDPKILEEEIQDFETVEIDPKYELLEDLSAEEEAADEDWYIYYEPIAYTGMTAKGADVVLMVNFKTEEITGTIDFTQGTKATITNGKMDPDILEITAYYSGTITTKENEEVTFNGTITGKITDDLRSLNGIILPDIEDAEGTEFTVIKDYCIGPCSL